MTYYAATNEVKNETPTDGMIQNESGMTENRLEVLKALATLILLEVESLEGLSQTELFKGREHIDLGHEVQQFEKKLIRNALARTNGNQKNAARILGTKITTLHAKIKKYGVKEAFSLPLSLKEKEDVCHENIN